MPPQNPQTPPIDPASFLLPKKEQTPTTAQRVNAGVLLQQEQTATLKPEPAATPEKSSPVQAPNQPKEGVSSLQTYRGDIEKVVEGGASIVSMASAEAERRSQQGGAPATPVEVPWRQYLSIAAGVVLLALAGGAIAYLATRNPTVPVAQPPQAPFIAVDETVPVQLAAQLNRATVLSSLSQAKANTKLALGLVAWLYPLRAQVQGSTTAPQALTGPEFLASFAPNAPQSLLRVMLPTYLVGLHSYDENEIFMLFAVDSYEVAYAGMLEWERSMRGDLSPLLDRTPSLHNTAVVVGQGAASSTASSVGSLIDTGFVDKVVENRDTRVVQNEQGDILLLWTMLGRNTVLITNNEYTLREVIGRINTAPSIPTPGR